MSCFPGSKGCYNGMTDSYDTARHKVVLGANPASRIRSTFRENATVSRVEATKPAPNILACTNMASSEVNADITVGKICVIDGKRLKHDPSVTGEGILFVDDATGTEYAVTEIQKNKPSQLVFLVPTIPLGLQLQIEVRSHFGEELRIGRLDAVLTTVK